MAGMSRATRKKRHDRELTDPKCFSDCIPIRQPLRSEPVESLLVGSSPRLPWCFALCLGYGWWWWWQRCFSGDSDSCFPIDWQSKLDSYLGVVSPLRLVGNDNVCWGRTLLSFSEARQQQVKWLGSFFSLLRAACPIGPKRRQDDVMTRQLFVLTWHLGFGVPGFTIGYQNRLVLVCPAAVV